MLPISGLNTGADTIAHLIQVALTPVFLLSGIGTLLNVFNTRLARVSDHAEHTHDVLKNDPEGEDAALLRAHLWRLTQRRVALDVAIALCALAGAAACGTAVTLFLGVVRDANGGVVLIALFGMSLGCTVGALAAFVGDTILAWHGLRREGPMPHPRRAA